MSRCTYTGKSGYADKKAAVTVMNRALRRSRNRPNQQHAYFCDRCRQWHLTHREERA